MKRNDLNAIITGIVHRYIEEGWVLEMDNSSYSDVDGVHFLSRGRDRDRAYSLLSFHPTEAFLAKYIRQRRGWKTVKPADIIIEKRDGAYWIRKDFGNRDFFAVSFPPER